MCKCCVLLFVSGGEMRWWCCCGGEEGETEMNGEKWYMYMQKGIHLFFIVIFERISTKEMFVGKT